MQQEKTAFLAVIWSWFLPRHQTGTEGLEIAPLAIIWALQHLEIEPRSHISSEAPLQFTLVPRNHYCPVSSLPHEDWKQSYSAHLSTLFLHEGRAQGSFLFLTIWGLSPILTVIQPRYHLHTEPNAYGFYLSPQSIWKQAMPLVWYQKNYINLGFIPQNEAVSQTP